jgi:hypothetical protein
VKRSGNPSHYLQQKGAGNFLKAVVMMVWHALIRVRPQLYYRAACPVSRGISLLSSALSLGIVRRVPLSAAQAREVFTTFRIRDGRPALLYAGRFITGPRMALAIGTAMADVLRDLIGRMAAGARRCPRLQ